jgi:hypothetical protein
VHIRGVTFLDTGLHRFLRTLAGGSIASALLVFPAFGAAAPAPDGSTFWPSTSCANCHGQQLEQHFRSHHEKSFTSPVFQAQYFRLVLPRVEKDPALAKDAARCTACHSPVAWALDPALARTAGVADPSLSGVTCDLCHTIVGFDGSWPQNGNFVAKPGAMKYGPFQRSATNHSTFNELQTRSELCGTCHEAVNAHGIRTKATFTEWAKSDFAKKGVQCQDCHMSRDGVFVDGGRYESGSASTSAIAKGPARERIYTHHFPGIHSGAPVEGAIGLRVLEVPRQVQAGQPLELMLAVDNSHTAHCLPTGSADLRLLWLEVTARIGEREIPLPATNRARGSWAAAGENSDDALLGQDVPAGARLYRAVYFDRTNHQTLASYDATAIAFDNRLLAGEKRRETYSLDVPRDAAGTVRIEARLRYRSYPSSLARSLGIEPPPVAELARAAAEVAILAPGPEAATPAAPAERLSPMEKLQRQKKAREEHRREVGLE